MRIMAYGSITARRLGQKIVIIVDVPERGEPSMRGGAENLVDPGQWIRLEDTQDTFALKMTLCRPYYRRASRRAS